MLKALLKKQISELFRGYFINPKTGRRRPAGGIAAMFLLFFFVLYSLAEVFGRMFGGMAPDLVEMGFGWYYFAFAGMTALCIGVLGSVFTSYSAIYRAKDNDLLLSMPIPPAYIITARISAVCLMSFIWSAVAFIPAVREYGAVTGMSGGNVIAACAGIISIGFMVAALCCLFGWLLALLVSKTGRKTYFTTAASLVFIGIYYYFFARMNTVIQSVVLNAEKSGESLKSRFYPAYLFGRAMEGEIKFAPAVLLCGVLIFALAVALLSKNFNSVITSEKGEKKKKITGRDIKSGGAGGALLKKEFARFTGSSAYMLNSGMGIIVMLAFAVIILIRPGMLESIALTYIDFYSIVPVLAAAAVCALCGMVNPAAASVSLEGKNLWITRSMPVATEKILAAKIKMQVILSAVPGEILALVLCISLKFTVAESMAVLAFVPVYCVFTAAADLALNLHFPNLQWTNEAVPIKQSLPAFISLFGGWILSVLIFFGYIPFSGIMGGGAYLISASVVFIIIILLLRRHLKTKGKELFETL